MRDYGTATWEGGDAECEHKVGGKPRSTRPLGLFHGGDDKFVATPTGNICPKCGARRIDAQLGLEQSPEDYISNLVEVFREVKRVLHPSGILWIVIGDSFWGGKDQSGQGSKERQTNRVVQGESFSNPEAQVGGPGLTRPSDGKHDIIKSKDLVGIPWMLAFALRADGWYLRREIIWAKGVSFCPTYSGSCMPESVGDRPTTSHEYVFMLSKSKHYFYDQEGCKENSIDRESHTGRRPRSASQMYQDDPQNYKLAGSIQDDGKLTSGQVYPTRNLRSVWVQNPGNFKGKHYAGFPENLIEPMIKLGASPVGCCPKCKSPWERVIERQDKRHWTERGDYSSEKMQTLKATGFRNDGGGSFLGNDGVTIGWQPTCTCGLPMEENVKCIVFDPFVGSGTTILTARRLGHIGIGLDLNFDYLHDIARDRLGLKHWYEKDEGFEVKQMGFEF